MLPIACKNGHAHAAGKYDRIAAIRDSGGSFLSAADHQQVDRLPRFDPQSLLYTASVTTDKAGAEGRVHSGAIQPAGWIIASGLQRRFVMKEAVIVSAVRLPIGKFQGSLSGFTAPTLGAMAVREAVRRAGVEPAQVEECIMGCVLQAGLGQNPARQAAIYGGLPPESSALTVNQVCGSGLRAVALAGQAVQNGDADTMVGGGMESMTNAPYLLPQARSGYR